MLSKFKPRIESLEGREVPAAFSFLLGDGTIGSGRFSVPAGVDPAQSSQSLAVTDLGVLWDGAPHTAQPGATAQYANGVLVGVVATAIAPGSTVELTGSVVVVGDYSASLSLDGAETELAFDLYETTGGRSVLRDAGAISYNIPWASIDPTQSSQSLAVSNFTLNIAGQNLTEASGLFTASPEAQFANGVFQGLTFYVNTATLAGFPYTAVWMSGTMTVSAQPPAVGQPPVAPPPRLGMANARNFIELNLSGARGGPPRVAFKLELVVKSTSGETIVSAPLQFGATATDKDVRDAIALVLEDSGLEIVTTGDHMIRLRSKGNTKLGSITYDTFDLNGVRLNLPGPTVNMKTEAVTLTVNGNPR